jgi:hypothetical protein
MTERLHSKQEINFVGVSVMLILTSLSMGHHFFCAVSDREREAEKSNSQLLKRLLFVRQNIVVAIGSQMTVFFGPCMQ